MERSVTFTCERYEQNPIDMRRGVGDGQPLSVGAMRHYPEQDPECVWADVTIELRKGGRHDQR